MKNRIGIQSHICWTRKPGSLCYLVLATCHQQAESKPTMFMNGFQNYIIYVSDSQVSVPFLQEKLPRWHLCPHCDDLSVAHVTVTLRPLGHFYTQYLIAPTPGSDSCPFPPPRVSRMHDPQGVNTVLGLGHSFQLACCPISNNSGLIFFKSWVCVLILIIRVGEKPGDFLVQETEQCA